MSHFIRSLGPFQGIAMTVTTFVGTGLMVLPAMSVTVANDFAFFSWLITVLVIIPIAIVFALLGAKLPSSAGASHYVANAFGEQAAKAIGWLFLSIMIVGPSVAIKVCAYYLAIILNVSETWLLELSMVTILGLFLFSIIGVESSAKIQTSIVVVMLSAVIFLAIKGEASNAITQINIPLALPQWQQSLSAVSLVFWCFLGIEVMAHMGAEFKNPVRDFPIAMIGGISIVISTYLILVLLISAHGTYGSEAEDSQSIARLVDKIIGGETGRWFAIGAFVISFANTAIYTLGFGRMVQALAHKKSLPTYFKTLNKFGSPSRAMVLVCGVFVLSVVMTETLQLNLYWLIEMTNGAFLTIYLFACLAAWTLLSRKLRGLILVAILACLFFAFQIGWGMVFAFMALALAFVWEKYQATRLASQTHALK